MAEAADSKVLTGVSKEAAEDAKKKLVEAGGEVVVA
jgi:ribosomal protein L7/L12